MIWVWNISDQVLVENIWKNTGVKDVIYNGWIQGGYEHLGIFCDGTMLKRHSL